MAKRWTCVEAGCDKEIIAVNTETAVRLAQEHIEVAHDSFELEDMIETVLTDVPASG